MIEREVEVTCPECGKTFWTWVTIEVEADEMRDESRD